MGVMGGLYTRLVATALFPVHERLKGHSTVSVWREMEQSQWWTSVQLQQWQDARLKELLTYAGRHVPYYRDVFREQGFHPADAGGIASLERLPFLTKDIIRKRREALTSDVAGPLQRFNTGGSTGEPLIFLLGRERISHDVAAKWRATRWWNVDIGDPEVVVWGSPIELGAQDRFRVWRDRLFRSHLLSAFELSDANTREFIRRIRKIRPKMLFGYPSSLAYIGRFAERVGIRLNDLGIRVAFVTSERLYEDQRRDIERVFGCAVANGYGGRDAGFIAHECPQGGMHITAEDIIVEIVDEDGLRLPPGESGEVVITHLATWDFPFIRYRTGDLAVLDMKTCGCGRGLPLLKEIQGRTTEFIVARDGTVLHGLALIYIIRDLEGVENFKIIQESTDLTRVELVSNDRFTPDQLTRIVIGIRKRLGDGVEVRVEQVPHIAREASGKHRYVVSKVGIQ